MPPKPPESRLVSEGGKEKNKSKKQKHKKPDNLTVLLCSACRALESLGYDFAQNPSLDKWWDNHKKEDREREIEELREQRQREYVKTLLEKPVGQLEKDELKFLREQGEL